MSMIEWRAARLHHDKAGIVVEDALALGAPARGRRAAGQPPPDQAPQRLLSARGARRVRVRRQLRRQQRLPHLQDLHSRSQAPPSEEWPRMQTATV